MSLLCGLLGNLRVVWCCFRGGGAGYSLRVAKGKKKATFDDEHRPSCIWLEQLKTCSRCSTPLWLFKQRFVWSLISAVGIFCLGSGAIHDMQRVLEFLKSDPVVDALYDCKGEVIGPGFFRFKAEIDFNGVVLVQNYLERTGRGVWAKQFREAAMCKDDTELLSVMANYVEAEVDRLESEIQKIVPGIKHVDIEAHNPEELSV